MIRRLRILAVFGLVGPFLAALMVAIPLVSMTGDLHSASGRANAAVMIFTVALYGMMIICPAGLASGAGYCLALKIFPRLGTVTAPLRAIAGALLGLLAGAVVLLIYFNGPLYLVGPIRQINLLIYTVSFTASALAGAMAAVFSAIPAFVGPAPVAA